MKNVALPPGCSAYGLEAISDQKKSALPGDIKRVVNPKHEIRNAKQYTLTKIQMSQTVAVIEPANMVLFLVFGNLIFEFVSNFDIRISDFTMLPG